MRLDAAMVGAAHLQKTLKVWRTHMTWKGYQHGKHDRQFFNAVRSCILMLLSGIGLHKPEVSNSGQEA